MHSGCGRYGLRKYVFSPLTAPRGLVVRLAVWSPTFISPL